jgi:DNA-binding NarL/FixJ family response regulator
VRPTIELTKTELIIRVPVRLALLEAQEKQGEVDLGKLTRQQMAVLKGILKGKVNKEIACELNIAERTVKYHASAIYARTGLDRHTLLCRYGTVQ